MELTGITDTEMQSGMQGIKKGRVNQLDKEDTEYKYEAR